jgi:cAMP-dependent protein kinase regulator
MEEVHAEPGQAVITEGEKGDTLYIIDEGEFDCFKVIAGKQTYLKTYHAGDFFGELALMYNAPRAASIKCKTAGKLFGLDRATFNHIVQEAATKKRKYYSEILSKVEILAEIDPYEKEQLCDSLKEEEFAAGSYIVKQGDQGDRFYIISEGRLIAEKKESATAPVKKVFEYKEGDYFGEIALVKNTVRQASVKAETDCRVVSIERDAFKRLLGPIEDILQRNMDKYKKYLIQ